jgi:hypothetical protein
MYEYQFHISYDEKRDKPIAIHASSSASKASAAFHSWLFLAFQGLYYEGRSDATPALPEEH